MFTAAGQTDTINYSFDPDNGGPLGTLTATLNISVITFTSGSIVLGLSLENTTAVGGTTGYINAAVTAFGFYTNPEVTGTLTQDGSVFTEIANDGQLTGNFKLIDICLFPDSCNGGNINNGLAAGATDSTMEVTLVPESGTFSTLTIDPYAIKFQTSAGSFEFCSGTGCTNVSEPASLALLGLALMGIGLAVPRRRTNRAH